MKGTFVCHKLLCERYKKNKMLVHLIIAAILLAVAVTWVLNSLCAEISCIRANGWFARSGAVLILATIWSGLLTRPLAVDESCPDFVNILEHGLDDNVPLKEAHWTVRYRVPQILLVIELILGFAGTLIWAYGDLWLQRCPAA